MRDTLDKIRLVRGIADDLAEVKALVCDAREAPQWPDDAWAQLAGSEGSQDRVLLLARSERGKLLGWAAATRLLDRSELEYVVVDASHRGRGIARALLQGWMLWARELGAEELLLEVRASNAAALRLYRGLGFVEQGRRPGYYRDPTEAGVLMGLRLA
jgi:[ribosomal protein S18]-alanine N-acetyltransferase